MSTSRVSLFREERKLQILEMLKVDQRVEVARSLLVLRSVRTQSVAT